METKVHCLSHDDVNQALVRDLAEQHGLDVEVRFVKEGLPDGECRLLIVDLDSVAQDRQSRSRVVKELMERSASYPVVTFAYNLEDEHVSDLQEAGVRVLTQSPESSLATVIAAEVKSAVHSLELAEVQENLDDKHFRVAGRRSGAVVGAE